MVKMVTKRISLALRVDARRAPPQDFSPAGKRGHEQPTASDRKA